MTEGLKTVIYPVKDVNKAKAVYGQLLGVEPSVDEPYYVGYDVAGIHLGLDPNGHIQGMTAPVTYWHVADIKARLLGLLDAGAEVQQDVKDVGGGRLIAAVKDADGNVTGLIQDT